MRNNLGKVMQCVSHVNTRLRYVLKSEETFGSQTKVVTLQVSQERYEYVVNVSTELNALNGVFIKKDTASGEDSVLKKDKEYAVNET